MSHRESARTPGKAPPWEDGAGHNGATFGQWLRRQREVREITLREIADATKISLRYLQAFESDDFDALPASVFARGFLRQYTAYVGLDPDEAVNSFLQAMPEAEGGRDGEQEEMQRSAALGGRSWLFPAILVVLVLVLVVLVALWLRSRSEGERGSSAVETTFEPSGSRAPVEGAGGIAAALILPPPAADRPADAEEAAVAPLVVTLEFSEECWVELDIDGGARYVSELHVQGESLRIEARQRVRILTLGNPAGVRVEVNGEPWTLPETRAGSVLHDVDIERPVSARSDGEPSASSAAE